MQQAGSYQRRAVAYDAGYAAAGGQGTHWVPLGSHLPPACIVPRVVTFLLSLFLENKSRKRAVLVDRHLLCSALKQLPGSAGAEL